jgi:hypothetical protein
MTPELWILLDHVVALLSIGAWFGAAVGLALRRSGLALAVLVVAVLVTLLRVATVAVLAGHGWWFVQEKVLLGLPLMGAAAGGAAWLAGRQLLAARRGRGDGWSAGGVVAVLMAAYAAIAGLVATFLIGYPLTPGPALITIAGVGAAALLTARTVALPAESTSAVDAGFPELDLLRYGTPAAVSVDPRAGRPALHHGPRSRRGQVDTFDVRPGQTGEVAFRATNPGIWMNHCHNLPHADQGMMLRLQYDGVTTPFGPAHDHA